MRKKLFLETFGCQMNVLDSELVMNQLCTMGFERTDLRDQADVVLYNTCSVREHAEQKVWSRLGELREVKAGRPELVIGMIGCMAEREGRGIFRRYPHLDILCGPGELDKLPAMVHNALLANAQAGQITWEPVPSAAGRPAIQPLHQSALMAPDVRRAAARSIAQDNLEQLDLSRTASSDDGMTQAYVRITRGCNKFCSYCVVPYTRGPEIHRPPQNIVDEVRKLADAGVLEVTLLGQTVNHYAYRHDDGRQTSFADLLYQVHEAVPHLPRLRFVTSFPRDFTDQALQVMRDCSRICRYLHIPAQHGNDRLLKLMNRGYTVAEYRELIDRARSMMPDVCIVSDFIVGFPTETDAEFQQTVDLVRYCRFKNSFIFKYSPRPGTHAMQRYADDVPEEIKRQRNNELLAVQSEVCAANNLAMIGQTLHILVEGPGTLLSSPLPGGGGASGLGAGLNPQSRQMLGRSRGDQIVAFAGEASLKGTLVSVRITSARQMTLFGELV